MHKNLISGGGVKPACSKDFNLLNKFINYLKALRYYGTKTLRNVFQLLSHSTIKQNLFTVCSVHFNARKFPSNLVPKCLRTFCNGLLRFTRNDGLFTTHHSRLTKAAFTLAETLIVIGIIGVVAALTLPNLNHATGDKETVTRLQKAYSMLNEANDRAVAIYGPLSEWSEDCRKDFNNCWMKRIGEFLKISKSCDETVDEEDSNYSSCDAIKGNIINSGNSDIAYQLSDGITIMPNWTEEDCKEYYTNGHEMLYDICLYGIIVDINGANKGKNLRGFDTFHFMVSDKLGVQPFVDGSCIRDGYPDDKEYCTAWVLENGNLDYLKADNEGNCNDSDIVLDGVTNTSCH